MAAGGRSFMCLLLLCSLLLFSLAHACEARGRDGSEPDAATVGQDQTLLHDSVHGEQFGSGNSLQGGKLAIRVANEMKMVEGGSGGVRIGTSFAVARTYRRAMKRCEGGGGGLREERRAGCRRRLNGGFAHEEVDGANFVAFNADYSAPRHHPPKNN